MLRIQASDKYFFIQNENGLRLTIHKPRNRSPHKGVERIFRAALRCAGRFVYIHFSVWPITDETQ